MILHDLIAFIVNLKADFLTLNFLSNLSEITLIDSSLRNLVRIGNNHVREPK
tara:strand:+ start:503 stop:658 length:156 start_codon:yes stop_codon:yes gene_type:complete